MLAAPTTVHMHRALGAQGHGGAPRNYADVWQRCTGAAQLRVSGHNFFDKASRHAFVDAAASFTPKDTVLCNAGPYGHLYHAIRELSGANFPILRDVRTAFWAPYLLQESLCAPLLRPGDILVAPSEYAASVYVSLFPHLRDHDIRVAYPLDYGFDPGAGGTVPAKDGTRRIGYLGRLSDDKSFPELAAFLQTLDDRLFSIVLAGPLYPSSRASRNALAGLLKRCPTARYLGVLNKGQLAEFFSQIDVLLFLSNSSNETFGRVHAEACWAGTPVIAADFGPTSLLGATSRLIPTRLPSFTNRELYSPFSFGWVDEESLRAALLDVPAATPQLYRQDRYAGDALVNILMSGSRLYGYSGQIDQINRAFIDRLSITGIAPDGKQSTLRLCRAILDSLDRLAGTALGRSRFLLPLLSRSRDKLLLRVLLERSFGNVDISVLRSSLAFCASVDFNPRLNFS